MVLVGGFGPESISNGDVKNVCVRVCYIIKNIISGVHFLYVRVC